MQYFSFNRNNIDTLDKDNDIDIANQTAAPIELRPPIFLLPDKHAQMCVVTKENHIFFHITR